MALYERFTGRSSFPTQPATEAWLICGRRAGKSFIVALVATYLATFKDYRQYLAPGERATVLVLAADRKQARVIMRYIKGFLSNISMLSQMVENETAESIDLTNNVTIEVGTASFRSTRGYSLAAVCCDEIAFWRSEDSANPDTEILTALRPGMASIPGSVLMCASSPYARKGEMWKTYKKFWAKDNGPLIWKSPSLDMNPSLPQSVVDKALEDDPAAAQAEWLAEFRTDVETFISREVIDAVISPGVHERAPIKGIEYVGFCDPSGGAHDSMTLAIAHKEGDVAILDALRERRPPFSPESVVKEFAALLKSYRIASVRGDRYAGEWPRERFQEHGIKYLAAKKPKSDIYREILPALNSKKIDLLDNQRLITQLVGLERRTARGGRDSIDHGVGAHDDVINAAAGALLNALHPRQEYRIFVGDTGDSPTPPRRGLSDMHNQNSEGFGYFDGSNIDSFIRGR